MINISILGTPENKLHWAYRLYDADGNGEVEIDEMEEVFVRLCKISSSIEAAEKDQKIRQKRKAAGLAEPEKPKPVAPPPEPKPAEEGKKKPKFRVKVYTQPPPIEGVIIKL